jgi:hypothetical protein
MKYFYDERGYLVLGLLASIIRTCTLKLFSQCDHDRPVSLRIEGLKSCIVWPPCGRDLRVEWYLFVLL